MNFYKRHLRDERGHWVSYGLLPRAAQKLPRGAGVYVIYFDHEIVYVGQSCDVAVRLAEHKIRYGYGKIIISPWGDVDQRTTVTVKVKRSLRLGDWAMWELRLIAKLKPRGNRVQRLRKRA